MKKMVSMPLTGTMAVAVLAGAGTSEVKAADKAKIGVLVADVSGEEAQGFRSYYENYIAGNYDVEFIELRRAVFRHHGAYDNVEKQYYGDEQQKRRTLHAHVVAVFYPWRREFVYAEICDPENEHIKKQYEGIAAYLLLPAPVIEYRQPDYRVGTELGLIMPVISHQPHERDR